MIRIRIDETLYIVSKESLCKFPDSDLFKITYDETNIINPYLKKENRDNTILLYIDVDPNSMDKIIKILRGDPIPKYNKNDKLFHETLQRLKLKLYTDEDIEKDIEKDLNEELNNELNNNSLPVNIHQILESYESSVSSDDVNNMKNKEIKKFKGPVDAFMTGFSEGFNKRKDKTKYKTININHK